MAKIHKLSKNGQTIYPATTTDAVAHPTLKVSASKLIGEINVSNLYPTGGTDGTNKYTLASAIAKIPTDLRTVGIKCSFLNEANQWETWMYNSYGTGAFLILNRWVKIPNSLDLDEVERKFYYEKVPGDNKDGYYITPSGVENTSETASIMSVCVKEGEEYTIVSNEPGALSVLVAFYDSDNNFMSYFGTGSSGKRTYSINVPRGCTTMKVVYNRNYPFYVYKHFKNDWLAETVIGNVDKIASLKSSNKELLLEDLTIKNTAVRASNGKVESYEGWDSSEFIAFKGNIEIKAQAGANYGLAFYSDADENNFIKGSLGYNTKDYTEIEPPEGSVYFRISGNSLSNVFSVKYTALSAEEIINNRVPIILNQPETISLLSTTLLKQVVLPTDFEMEIDESLATIENMGINANTGAYQSYNGWKATPFIPVKGGSKLYIKGLHGQNYGIAFYEGNNTYSFISGSLSYDNKDFYEIEVPANANYFAFPVLGTNTYSVRFVPGLSLSGLREYVDTNSLASNIGSIVPQIQQVYPTFRDKSKKLRFLYFGSSHGMCTWWYLNKIVNAAGIGCEFVCFYTGGATFEQWVQRYENDESVYCMTSVGTNSWEGNYKNFRTTLEEGWDIIGFQQGAANSTKWDPYEGYWSKLVSYVRRSCDYHTVIALNQGVAPAKNSTWLSQYGGYTVDETGQNNWTSDMLSCYKKLCALSGLYHVNPSAIVMYLIRHDSSLKDDVNDLADDTIHPNNGMPMYALASCFYETYIAPMYGISIDEIDWIPDESTQKAQVSGESWTNISVTERDIIRKIIKLAASDRWGFPSLIE